ncbi:MAG: cytochrome P450, partial [Myxococcota bacterium]
MHTQSTLPGWHDYDAKRALAFATAPFDFLEQARRAHGDMFAVHLGQHGVYVFIAEPEILRELQAVDPSVFRGDGGNAILAPLLGHSSVLLIEGAAHRARRKMLRPVFKRSPVAALDRIAQRPLLKTLDALCAREELTLRDTLQDLGLDVILSLLFGACPAQQRAALAAHTHAVLHDQLFTLNGLTALATHGPSHGALARFAERSLTLREAIARSIADRRSAPAADSPRDTLDVLLAARDAEGNGLDDTAITDDLVTLIITGHETTVTALMWACVWILSAPEPLAMLTSEVRALPDHDLDALAGASYLAATCREALRLRPVVPIVARKLASPTRVGAYDLPAGHTVAPAIALMHQRPDLYPDPMTFRPERF